MYPSEKDKDFWTFRVFITHLLEKRGRLLPRATGIVLSIENLLKIRSVLQGSNTLYDTFTFIGDGLLNSTVRWHVHKRAPMNTAHGTLSVVKSNILEKNIIINVAEKHGIFSFSENAKNTHSREDIFKAFLAVIVEVIDMYHIIGIGYMVVTNIIDNLLYEIDLDMTANKAVDATTRLKEFITSQHRVKPLLFPDPFNKEKMYESVKNGDQRITIIRYPIRRNNQMIHEIIGTAKTSFEVKKTDAEKAAAESALTFLKGHYPWINRDL